MPIVATGVSFGYTTDIPLLRNLALDVAEGTSIGIMAPSGTGKSTLLAVIGGLRRPWTGQITVERTGADAIGPLISWVFQAMHLLPHRTALDNVAIALLAQGISRPQAEELAMAELDRFGVVALANRRQRDLSGGESQRVALARAGAARPAVVLADEPTANLDRKNADHVTEVLFRGFPRSALVVATHDPVVARAADRCFELSMGSLQPMGPQE